MKNLGGGDYLGGWCFLVLGENHLTFSSLNPSNLPENLPLVNINYSLMTYIKTLALTLFRMGFFGATHGWGWGKKDPPP